MPEQHSIAPDAKGKSPGLVSKILISKEFLVTATSVITGIGFFYKLLEKPVTDINVYSLLIEALNIIILLIGLVIFSRKYSFQLPPEDKPDFAIIMEQEASNPADPDHGNQEARKEKVKARVKQVSRLVYQLLNTFKGFAVCLILLYAFLFISDLNHMRDVNNRSAIINDLSRKKQISDSIYNEQQKNKARPDTLNRIVVKKTIDSVYKHTTDSIAGIDSFIENTYHLHTSLVELIMSHNPSNEIVVNEIIVSIVDNFFNVLSTAFLLMAFYILFHQKVDINKDDDDNYQSSNNYWMPLLIGIIIILLSTLIIITGFCKQSLQSLIVWMRITSGIFNGVGMLLLVSRFISMEYLYKQSDDIGKNFYLVGTTVILPIYVVIQPLWGIFQVNIENKEVLRQIILMLCLWGKIFFIMIVYYMLNNRWLHTYIYMMPVAEERIKLVTEKFDDLVVNIKHEKEKK